MYDENDTRLGSAHVHEDGIYTHMTTRAWSIRAKKGGK